MGERERRVEPEGRHHSGGRDQASSDHDDHAGADRRHDPGRLGIGEGAQFRAPLGRAVIGGVITSTLLTLVVIPTFYEILDEWREWVLTKLGLMKHEEVKHAGPSGPRPVETGGRLEKLA